MTPRITIEPGKRSGQPCIRGLRITAWDVLIWLAAGMTEQQILDDYPELEPDDFRAIYCSPKKSLSRWSWSTMWNGFPSRTKPVHRIRAA